LPPALRPDRSHVVIGTLNDGDAVILYVSPDHPDAWRRGEVRKLVAELMGKGFSVQVNCGDKLETLQTAP